MPRSDRISSALLLAGDSCKLLCNRPAPARLGSLVCPVLPLPCRPCCWADGHVHTLPGQSSECLGLVPSHSVSGDPSRDHHLCTELPAPDAPLEARGASASALDGPEPVGSPSNSRTCFLFLIPRAALCWSPHPRRRIHPESTGAACGGRRLWAGVASLQPLPGRSTPAPRPTGSPLHPACSQWQLRGSQRPPSARWRVLSAKVCAEDAPRSPRCRSCRGKNTVEVGAVLLGPADEVPSPAKRQCWTPLGSALPGAGSCLLFAALEGADRRFGAGLGTWCAAASAQVDTQLRMDHTLPWLGFL